MKTEPAVLTSFCLELFATIMLFGAYICSVKKYAQSKIMDITEDAILRQIKLKYENLFKLNIKIRDLEDFIYENLNKQTFLNMNFSALKKRAMALQIPVMFICIWKIYVGNTNMGLYIFSVVIVEIILKNLLDYEENRQKTIINIKKYLQSKYEKTENKKVVTEPIKNIACENEVEKNTEITKEEKIAETDIESEAAAALNEIFYDLFGI